MNPGGSGLNPDAAAYVPLSKRDGDSAKPAAAAATHPYVAQGKGSFPGSQMYMPKRETSSVKQMSDDDMEMDVEIEFLSATFSDLSYESIRDVYLANDRDLDATIEMLNQLEIFSNEAEEYLPETIEPSTSSAPTQKNASTSTSSRTPTAPSS